MSVNTETAASQYRNLDTLKTSEILSALWEGQMRAVEAVRPALDALEPAVEAAVDRLSGSCGRLIYVGAGSSGVISLLDSLELGPTFDWPENRLAIVIPSGTDLTGGLADDLEDSGAGSAGQIEALGITSQDVVVGVSASGGVVFTVEAVRKARELGALTIGFTNNADTRLGAVAHHSVVAETGAEVIAGATRLAAGTSQKALFNLFSTTVMTRLGGIYDNLMVNVRPKNAKLRNRCVAMVMQISHVSEQEATEAVHKFGTVKRAVLGLAGVPEKQIDSRLKEANGVLRKSLQTEDNQE